MSKGSGHRRHIRICLAVVSILFGAASCRHSQACRNAGWMTVSAYFGTIDVPCGWDVDVNAAPNQPTPSRFWLLPEYGLLINVLGVEVGEGSESDVPKWILDFNRHALRDIDRNQLRTFDSTRGKVYCAISDGPRVNAACVLWSRDGDHHWLAVAFAVAAEERRLTAVGGLSTLSRIAASARDFVDGAVPSLRKAP